MYLTILRCYKCGGSYEGAHHNTLRADFCSSCRKIMDEEKHIKYMADIRDNKTIEQRIEQIEEWIYENKDKIHSSHEYDRMY